MLIKIQSSEKRKLLWILPLAIAVVIFCFSAQDATKSGDLSSGFVAKFCSWIYDGIPLFKGIHRDVFMDHLEYFIRKAAHTLTTFQRDDGYIGTYTNSENMLLADPEKVFEYYGFRSQWN